MALETILLAYAGLAAGQSFASAYGIGAFVAGWALGARAAGRTRASVRRAALALGALVPAAALGAALVLRALGSSGGAPLAAPAISLAVIAAVGAAQGAYLPLAARAWPGRSIAALVAANLLGALAGAWWIGFESVSRWGRPAALALACAASVAAAASLAVGGTSARAAEPAPRAEPASPLGRAAAGGVLACATLWGLGLEWCCLRLAVLWVGSQAVELTLVLAFSLLALALGAAALAPLVRKDAGGVAALLAAAALASTWPVWAAPALRWVREGLATTAPAFADAATAAVLVVPALAPLGAVVPVLHASSAGEPGRRLGDLLAFELAGALLAGPLLHAQLVPALGVGGAIGALCLCAALAALVLVRRSPTAATLASVVAVSCAAAAAAAPEPALASPKLTDPALAVREFREDQHFAVSVVDDGVLGERTLLTDQFRAAGTGRDYRYMRVLGHLPLLLHPAPRRVAVLALGTGTTLGAVALHAEVEAIDVLEISPAVIASAPWFAEVNRGALASERVRTKVDDGRRTLALAPGRYDVLTMEPLLPDSPFGVYLYTPEFYAVAGRALAPGGVFCQWVPPHALEPRVFDAVVAAFAEAFRWSSAWVFGTQVLLLGTDAEPRLDAGRFPAAGALRDALGELGLATPAGVRARYVADLSGWPRAPRPVSDADPWIAWRRKPSGSQVLGWLAENLESLARASGEPPWAADERGDELAAATRAVRAARAAHARREREIRSGTAAASVEQILAPLRALPAAERSDPEVQDFVAEVEFLAALRSGAASLQAGGGREALEALVRAAELRPERADVHGYLAVALERAGRTDAAAAAWERALRACPGFERTPAGARAAGWRSRASTE
jgi:spermidine synthase